MGIDKGKSLIHTTAVPRRQAEEPARANARLSKDMDERKRVEEALLESEARYRSLFENTAVGIAIAEIETRRFLHANQTFCRMLGYSHEEITAMGVENIHPAESLEYVLGEFRAQARGEKVLAVDIPCLRRDGTILYADIATSSVIIDGKICNVGHFNDITERKRLTDALRENEARLRTVIEAMQEGITFSDEKGRFEAYNSSMERLTGYSADEANASSDFADILYPDSRDREKAYAGLNELTTTGMSREAETYIRAKDGKQKCVLVSTTLVPYKGQRMFLSSYHDITERKHTEGQITKLGVLKERLIGALGLSEKLKLITDGIVEIFNADFARIWLIREGDLCDKGCMNAGFQEGPDACRDRARCLHLVASSGRYTHFGGNHRRVPFGCYKIGRVASGEDSRFITNDVVHDPRIHDHEWAQDLGLVSFAGFRLISAKSAPIGVMALFSRQAIPPVEEGLLAGLANYSSQVILSDRIREALQKSETKFRSLFENANDAIFLLKEDIFVDCNTRTLQMFHCSREQIVGQPPYRFSPPFQPDGRDSTEKALEKIHAALAGNPQCFEWKHCLHDGTPFDAEVSLNSIELGSERFLQAIVRDISGRKLLEEELRALSTIDELTGLYNRRGFLTLSEQQLKIAERTKKNIVLLFIDLDTMKWINDTFGHLEGDAALVDIAEILRRTCRKSDIIGRMGGDEFALLAIDTTHEGRKTAARLRDALDSHNKTETRRYKLSLSVGVAHFDPENPCSLDELMARADDLMYKEKRTKRR
jgi:diguanylate cyclase (GGDEF)-like protein/PAS domain S-box-containing protein